MSTNRYIDLLKQGFMKPKKARIKTLFQTWLPNDDGVAYEGESEPIAKQLAFRYGGAVRKVKKSV